MELYVEGCGDCCFVFFCIGIYSFIFKSGLSEIIDCQQLYV